MYLIRLDDASEHWNKNNWHRMYDLLSKYSVAPIFAIIPQNTDPVLLKYPLDKEYSKTILEWISVGWEPALHGCNHFFDSDCKGINPVNNYSEFAGVSLDEQKRKIRVGYESLKNKGIDAKIFVAPAHTFDENTIEALRSETPIRIISDTVANDVYYEDEFYYIPQQSGKVRNLPFKVTTFCYHPNTMDDSAFEELENFFIRHQKKFISFSDIKLKKKEKSLFDKLLSFLYFHK